MGYEVYNVVSGSMEPALPVGSVVYVETVAPETVAQGDIIAYESGGYVITHRVVTNRLVEGEFVTKGDANKQEDMAAVSYQDLIGRVAYHIPVLGRFTFLYTSTVGKVYVIGFALCGLLLNILAGQIRARRREQEFKRQIEARELKLREQKTQLHQ
jgi:signal peptidase I